MGNICDIRFSDKIYIIQSQVLKSGENKLEY